MRRNFCLSFLILLCISPTLLGQLAMAKNAVISFHSRTILENIDAENNQVMALIDLGKKQIAFSCLMKQFIFPRKLMQQHFNESYVESDKYPKASFSGTFAEEISWKINGNYAINVKGKLTIHGVTREVNLPATIVVSNGVITGHSAFKLNPSDYGISIPLIVRNKIEKENTVKVKVVWQPTF